MRENEIAKEVVNATYRVHTKLGPGLLESVHKKQLLTYLRLTDKKLGLLINFGAPLIKHGVSGIVNGLRD